MSENVFEYAMLKSEKTSEIIFFIHVIPSWLNQDIELFYDNKKLTLRCNEENFTSNTLPKIAQDWLKHNSAKVYFANDNGVIIAETIVERDNKEIYETEN